MLVTFMSNLRILTIQYTYHATSSRNLYTLCYMATTSYSFSLLELAGYGYINKHMQHHIIISTPILVYGYTSDFQ